MLGSKKSLKSGNTGSRIAKPIGKLSILSEDMYFEGNITSQGDVQIEGKITGNLTGKSITIGTLANIQGDVFAEKVNVLGTVKGNIFSHQVELASSSKIDGDIIHTHLLIEKGASVHGFFEKTENPLKIQTETVNLDFKKEKSLPDTKLLKIQKTSEDGDTPPIHIT